LFALPYRIIDKQDRSTMMKRGTTLRPVMLSLCAVMVAGAVSTAVAEGGSARLSLTPRLETVVGLNLAVGAFAGRDGPIESSTDGFAGPGPGLGARGYLTFGESGFALALDLSFLTATIDAPGIESAVKNEYPLLRRVPLEIEASFWWWALPLTAGPRMRLRPSRGIELYCAGLAGIALVKMPDLRITGGSGVLDYRHDAAAAACLAGEVGVVFTDVVVGLRGFSVPAPDIRTRRNLTVGDTHLSDTYRRGNPFQSVLLVVGYRF
jgi:hypothetical protein